MLKGIIMRRILILLATFFLLFAVSPPSAQAAGPHFKHGGSPTCTITQTSSASTSTTCTATLAGLGNETVVVYTTVSGTATYTCTNQGGNAAAGQNKVQVGPTTSPKTSFPADQIKNGNLSFTTQPAVLTAPATVSGSAAGCPNNNWTGTNPQLTVTSVTLFIEQPPGTVIFTCTASDPAGLTGTFALTC